jgi:COMPASS component SWD3
LHALNHLPGRAGREKLADELSRLLEVEGGATAAAGGAVSASAIADAAQEMPPDRLVTLLRQAVAFQMEFRRYHPRMAPAVTTLARDYQCPVVPNAQRDLFVGHAASVKVIASCCCWRFACGVRLRFIV